MQEQQIEIIIHYLIHRDIRNARISSKTSIGGTPLPRSYFEICGESGSFQAALPFLFETGQAPHESAIAFLLVVLVYFERGACE